MLGLGNLHSDRAEGSWRVPRGEDILLPEAFPTHRRQHSHQRHTRLLEGVVALGGDHEPAHSLHRLPGGTSHMRSVLSEMKLSSWKGGECHMLAHASLFTSPLSSEL